MVRGLESRHGNYLLISSKVNEIKDSAYEFLQRYATFFQIFYSQHKMHTSVFGSLWFRKIVSRAKGSLFGIIMRNFNEQKKLKEFRIFGFSDVSSSERTVLSLKGILMGDFWHCMITGTFPNSFLLNISKTLLFLNLQRGADLGSSRLVSLGMKFSFACVRSV